MGKYTVKSGEIIIGEIEVEGYESDPNHKYIIYKETPPSGFITQMAKYLTDFYLWNIKKTLKQWRESNQSFQISYVHTATKESKVSAQISYKIFARDLKEQNKFDFDKFNLQPPLCNWLDRSLDLSINFHRFDKTTNEVITIDDGTINEEYGPDFPVRPKLDREGHIFTSFQVQLLKKIVSQRKYLIESSDKALHYDWVLNLRTLINDSISIVDITLHQLYCKAEYLPEVGWTFDKEKLGNKYGTRIIDKFKWVRQISGNELNIETELVSFDNLREIRNHFSHFDPPMVLVTLEEAANWLNDILYVGQLLFKIRTALKAPISAPLIDLIVQREAKFNPEVAFTTRRPIKSGESGYSTSIWKVEPESKGSVNISDLNFDDVSLKDIDVRFIDAEIVIRYREYIAKSQSYLMRKLYFDKVSNIHFDSFNIENPDYLEISTVSHQIIGDRQKIQFVLVSSASNMDPELAFEFDNVKCD